MDYSYDSIVGRQIRAAREARGMTQEVGQRHIYAVELRAMRDILNVPYETLLP